MILHKCSISVPCKKEMLTTADTVSVRIRGNDILAEINKALPMLLASNNTWPVRIMANNNAYIICLLRPPYANGEFTSIELMQSFAGAKRTNYRRVVLDYKS